MNGSPGVQPAFLSVGTALGNRQTPLPSDKKASLTLEQVFLSGLTPCPTVGETSALVERAPGSLPGSSLPLYRSSAPPSTHRRAKERGRAGAALEIAAIMDRSLTQADLVHSWRGRRAISTGRMES